MPHYAWSLPRGFCPDGWIIGSGFFCPDLSGLAYQVPENRRSGYSPAKKAAGKAIDRIKYKRNWIDVRRYCFVRKRRVESSERYSPSNSFAKFLRNTWAVTSEHFPIAQNMDLTTRLYLPFLPWLVVQAVNNVDKWIKLYAMTKSGH